MEFDYEKTIENLEYLKNEFNTVYTTYNENMTSYELDNLYYKLYIIAYKFLIEGFTPLSDQKQLNAFQLIKFGLTVLSYSATTASIFLTPNAPHFTITALLASLTLSFKRRLDNTLCPGLNEDELKSIISIVGQFNDIIDNNLSIIDNQIQKLNTIEEINKLSGQEKIIHLASKNLLDILYHTQKQFNITNEEKEEMIKLIQKECNTDETNFKTLLDIAQKDFDDIDYLVEKYDKKANKLINRVEKIK